MAEVKIRWTQRAMGRFPGQEETVERTSLVDALAAQGRVEILSEAAPAVLEEVFVDMSAPVADPVGDTVTETAGDGSLDDLPAPAEAIKPGPRPRARRETGED